MQAAKHKLKIFAGAGRNFEVDETDVEKHRGNTVHEALMQIFADKKETNVQKMLTDPLVVLETLPADDNDDAAEAHLSPQERWEQILESLEKGDVALGIAKRHEGAR
ncbi:MAG: hypothetical protein C0404_05985 [Verrucomicrobia bacterium]|nr:hypothetical protein [Verrucomicrobiota bacterium]